MKKKPFVRNITSATKNSVQLDWHCVEKLKNNVPNSFVAWAISVARKPLVILNVNTDNVSGID